MPSLKGFAAAAIFVTSVWAAPQGSPATTTNGASPVVLFTPSPGNSVNDCGDSSFQNESSSGSPTVNDCLQIATNIAGGGTWTVSTIGSPQHQLVQYGTCAFGVTWNGSNQASTYYIGNQDIIDLIHSSINMFQWNGLVGSKGVMNCKSDEEGASGGNVLWGLYHN
jgi:hypothetical protein